MQILHYLIIDAFLNFGGDNWLTPNSSAAMRSH
jgi:hypothetical protein